MYELLLRPCESHEQSIFSWQIMFTSKFKNTHAHLEEMPSRFLCDLFGHICGQYCLACGQLSFCCFISASVCRNSASGPSTASAHPRKCMWAFRYVHAVNKYSQTRTFWTCLNFGEHVHMQFACTQHTLTGLVT